MNRITLASVFATSLFAMVSTAQAQSPPVAPPVAPFPVSYRSIRVVPSPAATVVRAVFARASSGFLRCNPGSIPGTVGLRMTTGANGEVASSRQRGSSYTEPNTAIASCVTSASRRMQFPSARDVTGATLGTLDIEITVVFGNPSATAPTPAAAPAPPPAPPPVAPPPVAPAH